MDFTAGRESSSQYNESYAGARAPSWTGVSGPQHVDAIGAPRPTHPRSFAQ